MQARLRALGYGPERATIAWRGDRPEGTRWVVTIHGPDGVLQRYLSAPCAALLAWLEGLPPPGS